VLHVSPVMSLLQLYIPIQSKQLMSPRIVVGGVLDADGSPATQATIATIEMTEIDAGHFARG